jgi:DNA-binding NarL/FixJ family response regulator
LTTISVFVCDDQPEARELTRLCLEETDDLHVVGDAGDAGTAVERITALEPDVVLLDLSMPKVSGLEAIHMIRIASPRTAVVILSGMSKARTSDVCLSLGAVGFVEKREPMERVREAVREAAAEAAHT